MHLDSDLMKLETDPEAGIYPQINPKSNLIIWHCDLCPKIYNSKGNAARHRSRHFEPKYPCPQCGKYFHTGHSVKQHLFHVHSNQKDFVCHICDYATLTKTSLQLHIIRNHTKDYPLSCDVCGKGYAKRHLLEAHRRSVHEGVEYACEECGKMFKYVHTLRGHRKLHNPTLNKKEEVQCNLCGGKYKCLKTHMERVHVGVKTFICEICGESFFTKTILKTHVTRKHTNEKPFKCNFCFHGLVTNYELKEHIKRRHSGKESLEDVKDKPFLCTICDRRFKACTSLTDHMRKHAGEKAYACNVCQEKFFSKHYLKSHNCDGIGKQVLQMSSK